MPRKRQPVEPEKPPRRKPGTGSVIDRPDRNAWVLRYTMPDAFGKNEIVYESLSKDAYTEIEADLYLDERITERDTGAVLRDRITVADYLRHWMAAFPRRAGTNQNRHYHVEKYLIPNLGHLEITELTKQHCRALWQKMHDSGKSLSLIRNVRATLKAALRDAQVDPLTEDLIDGNVASATALPQWSEPVDSDTEDDDDGPRVSTEVVRAIIDAYGDPQYKLAVMLSAYLGLRIGEVFGLTWSNLEQDNDGTYTGLWVRQTLVRVDRGWVLNPPKTAKSKRWLPLFGDLIPALQQREAQQAHEQKRIWDHWFKNRDTRLRLDGKGMKRDLIFTQRLGRPIHQQIARRSLAAVCEQIGAEPIRWHQLRHTTNSLLIELGLDDMTRLIIMGHANLATNRTYSHTEKDDLRRRMSPIEQKFKQG